MHLVSDFPVRRPLPRQPHAARAGPARAPRCSPSSRRWPPRRTPPGRRGKVSGTMYCGDHEHYAYLDRGVRPVRPRQRPAARPVPVRHPLRGRDHRDDPRPDARRRGRPSAEPGGPGHHRRVGQHPARRAGLPRAGERGRQHPPQPRQARDRAPGVRQGLPPARRRAAAPCRSTRAPRWSPPTRWPGRSTSTRWRWSAPPATTPTAPSTRSPTSAPWRWSAASACTSTAAWAASSCPFGEELGYDVPPFRLPRPGRHQHLGGHPQVRLRASRAPRCCCSATRRCATGSTSTRSAGAAGSTCRRASRARAPAGLLAATWASMVHLGAGRLPRATPSRSSRPRRR